MGGGGGGGGGGLIKKADNLLVNLNGLGRGPSSPGPSPPFSLCLRRELAIVLRVLLFQQQLPKQYQIIKWFLSLENFPIFFFRYIIIQRSLSLCRIKNVFYVKMPGFCKSKRSDKFTLQTSLGRHTPKKLGDFLVIEPLRPGTPPPTRLYSASYFLRPFFSYGIKVFFY